MMKEGTRMKTWKLINNTIYNAMINLGEKVGKTFHVESMKSTDLDIEADYDEDTILKSCTELNVAVFEGDKVLVGVGTLLDVTNSAQGVLNAPAEVPASETLSPEELAERQEKEHTFKTQLDSITDLAVLKEAYPEYITNKQIKSVSSLQEHIFKNFIESQA